MEISTPPPSVFIGRALSGSRLDGTKKEEEEPRVGGALTAKCLQLVRDLTRRNASDEDKTSNESG